MLYLDILGRQVIGYLCYLHLHLWIFGILFSFVSLIHLPVAMCSAFHIT